MPFKSEAQRRKFYEMHAHGKISKEVLEKWESETSDTKLPERVGQVEKKDEQPPNR